jgi:hypothetical protein
MAKYARPVVIDETTSADSQPTATKTEETRIAALAYELWLQRGCPIGSDQDDWFQAKTILRHQSEEPVKTLTASS